MLPVPETAELMAILPEITLVIGMCIALIAPLLPPFQKAFRSSHSPSLWIGLITLATSTFFTLCMAKGAFGITYQSGKVLGGMFTVDQFALTFKIILYAFSIFVLFMFNTLTRDRIRSVDGPDYITLILGGVLGMSMMASASNLLMVFMAIESASFPSYALAGFYKRSRRSSEAGMKYVLFGAASSAIMLYGLSMLFGMYGSLDLGVIAQRVNETGMTAGLWMGIVGLMVGIGFKLSAFPVHFWCPDVFEGAPFEITTFLSVASKGAAICLLIRILMTLGFYAPDAETAMMGIAAFIGAIGAITATWGNLAAYYQTNMKRLLAFSSIGHAGYMIMAASLAVFAGPDLAYALLFYIFVYCFMNYGAFTIAAIVARQSGSEDIAEYAGLGKRNPALAIMLGCFLFALFGMPLTGGFLGKVFIGIRMWEYGSWWLVVALVANTVLSLYLYMKPIIVMVWKPIDGRPAIQMNPVSGLLLGIATLGIFATGILADQSTGWIRSNAVLMFSEVGQASASHDSPVMLMNESLAQRDNQDLDSDAQKVDQP